MARRDWARLGVTGLGMAGLGSAAQGEGFIIQSNSIRFNHGTARLDVTRRGMARRGSATQGEVLIIHGETKMARRFEKSVDTHIIEGLLTKAEIGETVSYSDMSTAIGRDVREFARSSIHSALKAALRLGMIFEAKPNVGYVRLNDSEIVRKADGDKVSIRKKTDRAIDRLSVVKFETLTESDKKKHTVASAQLGAIRMFSTASATKKIESKVNGRIDPIPVGETLKMFTGEK